MQWQSFDWTRQALQSARMEQAPRIVYQQGDHVCTLFSSREEQISAAAKHLNHAAGFLRRELKHRLDLRHTPELVFTLDRSLAQGDRIMRLMRTIEEEHGHAP